MCITICSPPGSAPAAEGFALAGSRPLGCLLIHGFTATPDEMRPLGEALAARGFPVRAVRLAGHGTRVADLAATRWAEWFASVAEGADRLRRDVPALAVAGMSLGALLALHLAATRPSEVSALVLCGTPLELGGAGARVIESHVLERSWHVVTLYYDRDEVARLTADFLGRVEAGAAPPCPARC